MDAFRGLGQLVGILLALFGVFFGVFLVRRAVNHEKDQRRERERANPQELERLKAEKAKRDWRMVSCACLPPLLILVGFMVTGGLHAVKLEKAYNLTDQHFKAGAYGEAIKSAQPVLDEIEERYDRYGLKLHAKPLPVDSARLTRIVIRSLMKEGRKEEAAQLFSVYRQRFSDAPDPALAREVGK